MSRSIQEWEKEIAVSEKFNLKKIQADFKDFQPQNELYDLIYFDAFGMRVQPELWEESIFEKIFTGLKSDGLLTTYACNGKTKRALKAVGFTLDILPGPPGKREMINAWKR